MLTPEDQAKIQKNTVLKLDPFSPETPYTFTLPGIFGRVDAITPYGVNGQMYDSYTLVTIEVADDCQVRIGPCGYAYYVPAHIIEKIIGQWQPEEGSILYTS